LLLFYLLKIFFFLYSLFFFFVGKKKKKKKEKASVHHIPSGFAGKGKRTKDTTNRFQARPTRNATGTKKPWQGPEEDEINQEI
jgi:hypothetical protein